MNNNIKVQISFRLNFFPPRPYLLVIYIQRRFNSPNIELSAHFLITLLGERVRREFATNRNTIYRIIPVCINFWLIWFKLHIQL